MRTLVLLLVCFLKYTSVEARPLMTSFSILQGSSRWDIGEPRLLPDLNEILALQLPHSLEKFQSTGFSYCNKVMTLNPREVFTVTFPVDRRSCLIYLRAPRGYLLEQRSHPIVRFSSCNKEQLRFSSGVNTLVYCNGGHSVHFQGDHDYVAIMYQGISSNHRQEIRFAVSVKPVASLPGSTKHITTGTSEILWRDPEAEYKPRAVLELARQDESLQICPKTCGASNEDGAYRFVTGTRAAEGELPYMVRVAVDYEPVGSANPIRISCGGSILNSRHVLTAAHCLLDKEKRGWDVVGRAVYSVDYNENDLNSHGQEISFDQFVVHPEYKSRMSDEVTKSYRAFDIAVLRLSEDILLGPNSWTICLAPGLDFMNKHATISGYGELYQDNQERNKDQPSEGAWKAGVVIADYVQKCQEFDRFKLEDNSYRKACTFGMTKEACLGDMGSPLAVAENSVWYQVGVATGGFCGLPGEPHFHVNVTTFADFIRQNVRGGRCN